MVYVIINDIDGNYLMNVSMLFCKSLVWMAKLVPYVCRNVSGIMSHCDSNTENKDLAL